MPFEHETRGNQNSKAILFIPSLWADGKYYWGSIANLVQIHPHYAIIPTIKPEDYSDVDGMLGRLAKLIEDTAEDGVAHIVGLRVGAHIALRLALKYPGVVSSLLLLNYRIFPLFTRFWAQQFIFLYSTAKRKQKRPFSIRQSRNIAGMFVLPRNSKTEKVPTMVIVGKSDNKKHAMALHRVLPWINVEIDKMVHSSWCEFTIDSVAAHVAAWVREETNHVSSLWESDSSTIGSNKLVKDKVLEAL